jgi:hypothetical protein
MLVTFAGAFGSSAYESLGGLAYPDNAPLMRNAVWEGGYPGLLIEIVVTTFPLDGPSRNRMRDSHSLDMRTA